ncbi:MAG: class I SAM-dependent methyltransferase [Dehalococcoidia bacterium]
MNEHLLANQRWWDEAVPIHAASAFYDVEGFKAGKTSLLPVERAELGDVRGKRLLHLMCHFGMDTLSWAREGATVTGIDFSAPAIETARALAAECGIEARFIQTNLYDLPQVLEGRFDVVFTSYGVLPWLPDVNEWARIATSYLEPGGVYIIEGHPLVSAIADDATAEQFRLDKPYFEQPEPTRWDGDGDYADPSAKFENDVTYEFSHSLGEIVSALAAAGLQIEFLHEHPFCAWARLPSMTRGDDGYYRLPGGEGRFPFMFSLRAHKPA